MKLIFNDATDMPIQSYEKIGGAVRFLTIGIAPEKLKEIFEDATKTKVMNVTERGQIIDTLENYTGYDHTEIYPGGIYGVVNNKAGLSTEERLDDMGIKLETAKQDIEALKENGGNGGAPGTYASVFAMAKISAEKITDDEQALKVADLYDLWSGDGVAYKTGKYITYQDALYKVLQNHTSQADWAPDTASSLYAKVLTDPTGKVLPWEQPNSTNPYKKGDRVTHKGKTWESLVDSNVWEPGAVGSESLWKEVAQRERKVRNMKMNYAEAIIDGYNAIAGAIVAVLSYILGEHWILFAAFLLLNVADWITGWMKSKMANKENSVRGWKGVLKKLGYWLMIMVAFGASAIFIEIGKAIGVDLGITTLLGWFVLASLLINEIRSILENFVEAGFNVPIILIKGLEVADKVVNKDGDSEGE